MLIRKVTLTSDGRLQKSTSLGCCLLILTASIDAGDRLISNLPVARLLLHLKAVDNRCQLAQDLVGLFVKLQLRSDKICEIS